MTNIGSPLSGIATRVLLCGSGELGKEVAIELQRLGIEVVAVDRYENAPAMQVAHRSHVISMLDGKALREVIENENPDFIVPELEALDTSMLLELEKDGYKVVPTARAAQITMNREGIRRLATEELGFTTSTYEFADTRIEYTRALEKIGLPCVVKPVMSSSGKGQTLVRTEEDIDHAWSYAQAGGRTGAGRVIVESFVHFDYEITLLTVRHKDGTSFCEPIGHCQEDGDYRESWQPHPMSDIAKAAAEEMAARVTDALGGYGIFGVEMFVREDEVIFSEVSPRPHDTGMVTMISQDLSEFALHVRAILGLPIPSIRLHGPSASCVILAEGESKYITYNDVDAVLTETDTDIRLFGKPEVKGRRRMGVVLARAEGIEEARRKAREAAGRINLHFG